MKISRAEIEQRIYQLRQLLGDVFELDAVYHLANQTFFQGRPLFPQNVLWKESIQERLAQYGYTSNIEQNGDRFILTVSKKGEEKEKKIPWTNILLFLASVVTIFMAGAMIDKQDIVSNPLLIIKGASFAIPLILMLSFHEFGHYFVSRRRKIDVSLPYFIPGPTIFGTFGAVIKSKSPFKNRRDLIDVGAAGPIAGFVVAIVATIIGLGQSEIVPVLTKGVLTFGDSIIFRILSWMVLGNLPPEHKILVSPTAFAGWAGIFVTMLNLLPLGQLDGGHILYGLLGRKQHLVAWLIIPLLFAMGWFYSPLWFMWAGLALIMRPAHPPTLNDSLQLDLKRKIIGWIAIAIFVISFIPIPIR
ncbi:MAG TPA: site-2 protease family protein [candidate division Zixibacteria bacterium]